MLGLYRVVNRQEPRTPAQRERWEVKRRWFGRHVLEHFQRRVDEHDGARPSAVLKGE